MQPLIALILVMLHLVAAYGWGRLVERRLDLPDGAPAVSAGLGLACVIALGGLLNAAHLARPPALWLVTLSGLGLAARHRLSPAARELLRSRNAAAVSVLALTLLALVIGTVVPARTFDWVDDFLKYFVSPARMLATGSVAGTTLDPMGYETLGAQAYLHGFALSAVPGPGGFQFLNAVDVAFGLTLAVLLVGWQAARAPHAGLTSAVALCTLFAIDPQLVNISSTYVGAALLLSLCLLLAGRDPRDCHAPAPGVAAATGLVLAALCALKSTYVPFCGAVMLASAVLLARVHGARAALAWTARASRFGALCIAPWLVVHAPQYVQSGRFAAGPPVPSAARPYVAELWSSAPLSYSIGALPYTLGVLCALALAGVVLWRAPRSSGALACVTSAVALAVSYVSIMLWVGPAAHGVGTSLRLFTTLLIGTLPALTALALAALPKGAARVAGTLCVASLCGFAVTLPLRAEQPLLHGTVLALPSLTAKPLFVAFNQEVLHDPAVRERYRRAQAAVPEGQPLIVWAPTPFWLDYARNPIAAYEWAGLSTPWGGIPAARYVLFQAFGPSVPQLASYVPLTQVNGTLKRRGAVYGLRLRTLLLSAAKPHAIYDDGAIVVIDFGTKDALASAYYAGGAPVFPTR